MFENDCPTETTAAKARRGPLVGLRVLEIGHFVAAPFCTRLLADLGADVIKIEPPSGDPVRHWGAQVNGNSVWWSMHGRNKRSITVDLKRQGAAELVLDIARSCDAVVENFRPGQLQRLGLGTDALRRARQDIVIAHVSGFGQTGPYRDRAAFGVIGEAMGGLRHMSNHAPGTTNLPPVRVGVSIGDSITGLYAAFGLMAALWQRDRKGGDGKGRSIDAALTESVLSMMEGVLPEYSALGVVRQPTGSRISTAAPTSAYPTRDDGWILIAANSDPLFGRLAALMGEPALAVDPRFNSNQARLKHVDTLDQRIAAWTKGYTAAEAERILNEADVPASIVYSAKEIAEDPQYRARGMVREVDDPAVGRILHAGIVPHVVGDAGDISWPGPAIGAHTDEVLMELAGLDAQGIAQLRQRGVI